MTVAETGGIILATLDAEYTGFDEKLLAETREALIAAVNRSEKPKVILDLSNTNYFGSVFLETLFKVWHRVDRKGGQFALAGVQPYCREVLKITRLDTLWKIYDSVDEAMSAAA